MKQTQIHHRIQPSMMLASFGALANWFVIIPILVILPIAGAIIAAYLLGHDLKPRPGDAVTLPAALTSPIGPTVEMASPVARVAAPVAVAAPPAHPMLTIASTGTGLAVLSVPAGSSLFVSNTGADDSWEWLGDFRDAGFFEIETAMSQQFFSIKPVEP